MEDLECQGALVKQLNTQTASPAMELIQNGVNFLHARRLVKEEKCQGMLLTSRTYSRREHNQVKNFSKNQSVESISSKKHARFLDLKVKSRLVI